MHVLLWVALATWYHIAADRHPFVSCYSMIMYLPPLGFLWLAVGFSSFAFLIASITRSQLRTSAWFLAACHGLVLAIGLQASVLAAYAAAGQVNCL